MSVPNSSEPIVSFAATPIVAKGLLSINIIATSAGLEAVQNVKVIVVGNLALGPPVFNNHLINQVVNLNKYHEYTLPVISDIDGDPVIISIQMNSASPFTNFTSSSTFKFFANNASQIGNHVIVITLSDNNPYLSLSKQYLLQVSVIESLRGSMD